MMKYWNSETGESFSSSSSSGLGFNSPYNSRGGNARSKLCKHGVASLRTSHTPLNLMRRFYCCSRRGSAEDCGLWEWVDPELSDHYKESISKLKLDIVRVEEELDQATMVGTMNRQRLESKVREFNSVVVEIDLLKDKNEKLEAIVYDQFVKVQMLKWGICLVTVVFGVLWMVK